MSNLEKLYRNHLIWARYRRAMRWLAIGTSLTIALVFGTMWLRGEDLPIHFVIAVTLGLFCMVMLTAGLMGLVFVSSATDHDEDAANPEGDFHAPR